MHTAVNTTFSSATLFAAEWYQDGAEACASSETRYGYDSQYVQAREEKAYAPELLILPSSTYIEDSPGSDAPACNPRFGRTFAVLTCWPIPEIEW